MEEDKTIERDYYDFGTQRPPIYSSPEEMQKKITEYFKKKLYRFKKTVIGNKNTGYTEVELPKITISDLVLYLGFADRISFYDYEKVPQFSYTIKRAREFIAREYEEMLDSNPTGAIFALKNFGWSDKQILQVTSDDEVKNSLKTIAADLREIVKQNNATTS